MPLGEPNRVAISTGGRWHAYRLARAFHQRGWLSQLLTGYPKWVAAADGLPPERVTSLIFAELLNRAQRSLPFGGLRLFSEAQLHRLYDAQAAASLRPCDLYIGWSSFALKTLVQAKRLGAVTAIERVSSHIRVQERLLREEYARVGLRGELPEAGIVERELREYEQADFIVVPSTFAKKTFLEEGLEAKKMVQIPLGVDIHQFHPRPKTDGIFRVIYVGAISLRKGVHDLLEAFTRLHLPQSELCLIGTVAPEARPILKRYAGTFRWIPPHPHASLAELYAQGSLFALCSIEDGFGMVLLEAMASGLPVVCTENSGGPDLIENGREGFVLPARSPERVMQCLENLYRDATLQVSMAEAARKKAQQYSWELYGQRACKAYGDLIK